MNHDCDQHMRLRLPRHPRSVGRAREGLTGLMGLSGELGETAALLLSKLVTNALRHGSPPGREIVVTVRRADGLLRMEVEDAGTRCPGRVRPTPSTSAGAASRWSPRSPTTGVAPRQGPGKRVWVTLKAPDY